MIVRSGDVMKTALERLGQVALFGGGLQINPHRKLGRTIDEFCELNGFQEEHWSGGAATHREALARESLILAHWSTDGHNRFVALHWSLDGIRDVLLS